MRDSTGTVNSTVSLRWSHFLRRASRREGINSQGLTEIIIREEEAEDITTTRKVRVRTASKRVSASLTITETSVSLKRRKRS